MGIGEVRLHSASKKKKKRSLAQTGRCLHGKSLPSCERLFTLVESWQEPQLEIKFELEIIVGVFLWYVAFYKLFSTFNLQAQYDSDKVKI